MTSYMLNILKSLNFCKNPEKPLGFSKAKSQSGERSERQNDPANTKTQNCIDKIILLNKIKSLKGAYFASVVYKCWLYCQYDSNLKILKVLLISLIALS